MTVPAGQFRCQSEEPKMFTWQPNPHNSEYQDDLLIDEHENVIARLEEFGYAAYPMAFNAVTGNWERGGAFDDRVAAMQWAERVAGLHPPKAGDERARFYY
jgi:hypothetical protein